MQLQVNDARQVLDDVSQSLRQTAKLDAERGKRKAGHAICFRCRREQAAFASAGRSSRLRRAWRHTARCGVPVSLRQGPRHASGPCSPAYTPAATSLPTRPTRTTHADYPRGLPTRRERTRPRQGVPLVRSTRKPPRILNPSVALERLNSPAQLFRVPPPFQGTAHVGDGSLRHALFCRDGCSFKVR